MNYWDDVNHHVGDERMSWLWLADTDVRQAVNAAVAGSPHEWPLEWFAREYAALLPLGKCAVMGCGTGALERDLLSKRIAAHVTAVDVAPAVVAFAQREAERSGLQSHVSYVVADAAAFLRKKESAFDAIFFHGSLHHLEPVEDILRLTRNALRTGGLLYLDEYIGPSMRHWTWWRLAAANGAYYAVVPRALRRPRLIRAPRNPADPSEMVDSASILPAVHRMFRVISERGYGGNILGLVYPNLHHRSEASVFRRTVRRLIRVDQQVARIVGHHYAVIIALNEPPNSQSSGRLSRA
jgi:SAM-dependent methyltransferase